MKIVIAGGRNKADFLIRSLLRKNHKLIVINDDDTYCEYLAQTHDIPIVYGDACKNYVLREAKIQGADIIIALRPDDADNLAICQVAKRIFGVKKAVCIVSNPKNVEIFKKLGVNTAISATYLVANMVEQASTIGNFIKTLSIEDEKVILTEMLVDENFPVTNQKIMDISFPTDAIISCIIRGDDILVPNGQTVIFKNDKLLIISSPQNQDVAIRAVSGSSK